MVAATYKGFSTVGNIFGNSKITDTELIKRDLLNHFAIRKGEKLMNGNFGSSLADLIMEPLTAQTKNMVVSEINTIVATDPRIIAESIIIDEYQFGLQVEMTIRYVTTNQSEKLLVRFNRSDGTVI